MRSTESLKDIGRQYLKEVSLALSSIDPGKIERIASIILQAYRRGNKIILMGNGGSAAAASHFACDLAKGCAVFGKKRLEAYSLCDSIPLVTAYANDCGYDEIFSGQLRNIVGQGDVVMAISASGNSRNVLNAVKLAGKLRAVTVGLTGFKGGKLKGLVSECLVAPGNDMEQIEDAHLAILHAVKKAIIAQVGGGS